MRGEGSATSPQPGAIRHVVVAGAPRMGTTWVANVLRRGLRAQLINEPDNDRTSPFAMRAKLGIGRYPVLGNRDRAPVDYYSLWDRAFAGITQAPTLRQKLSEMLLSASSAEERWDCMCQRPPRISLRMRAATKLASTPAWRSDAERVIVKSVHGPLALEWIWAQFRPRMVVVVRNPLNVVASWMEFGWGSNGLDTHPLTTERYIERWGLNPPGAKASILRRVVWEIGLFTAVMTEAVKRNREWIMVSHDAVCRDPYEQFHRLAGELGEDWDQAGDDYIAVSNAPGEGLSPFRIAVEQPESWMRRLTRDHVHDAMEVLSGFPFDLLEWPARRAM